MLCRGCYRHNSTSKKVLHLEGVGYFDIAIAKKIIKTEGIRPYILPFNLVKGLAKISLRSGVNRIHALFHINTKEPIIIGTINKEIFTLDGNNRITRAFLLRKSIRHFYLNEKQTEKCFMSKEPETGKIFF